MRRGQAWRESAARALYCQLISLVFVRSQEGRGDAVWRGRWRRRKIVFISFELFMTCKSTCYSRTRLDGEGWEELSLPLKPQSTWLVPMEDQEKANNDRLSWRKWSSLNLYCDLESRNTAPEPCCRQAQDHRFPSSLWSRRHKPVNALYFDFAEW